MDKWLPWFNSIGMFVGTALLAWYIRVGERRERTRALLQKDRDAAIEKLSAERERVEARFVKIETAAAIAEVQFRPFWAALQTKLVTDLTHPHEQFARADELMRKLEMLNITGEERMELTTLMEERMTTTDPLVSDIERIEAHLMIGAMELVLGETSNLEYAPSGTMASVAREGGAAGDAASVEGAQSADALVAAASALMPDVLQVVVADHPVIVLPPAKSVE